LRGHCCLLVLAVTSLLIGMGRLGSALADEAFVTDQQANAISVVDLTTQAVVATISVAGHPAGIAMTRDGLMAYVTSPDGHSLSVIDTAARQVIRRIVLGGEPVGVTASPSGLVYVADWISDRVLVVDPVAGRVVTQIQVGRSPSGLAVTSDGTLLVCADRLDDRVSLVSLPDNTVVATVAVGRHPFGIVLDDQGRAFAADVESNDVAVIDLASRRLLTLIPTGPRPYVVALSIDHGFVTNELGGSVTVFDLRTLKATGTVDVGAYPEGVQVDHRGHVYVVNWMDDTVMIVDEQTLAVSGEIKVGASPRAFGTFIRFMSPPP
jgi:YVTN family beta-propeller protein